MYVLVAQWQFKTGCTIQVVCRCHLLKFCVVPSSLFGANLAFLGKDRKNRLWCRGAARGPGGPKMKIRTCVRTGDGRNFASFAKFSMFSQRFWTFSLVFRSLWRCSDQFGPVRIRSDAFRCAWVPWDALGRFRKIPMFFFFKTLCIFLVCLHLCKGLFTQFRHIFF